MAIQGLRNTGLARGTGAANDFVPDQRPLDWRSGILLLYPNGRAPLTALTSQMKKRTTTDPEFNWWDKALKSQRYEMTVAINTVVTVIVIAEWKELRAGHIMLIEESGEMVRVDATPTSSSVTVTRNVATATEGTGIAVDPAVAGTNPFILVIGSAFEEGSQKPDGINFDPVKRRNYSQIFRWNIGMTNTAAKTRLRTGDQVREAKREALEYHSIEQEKAFWLGKSYETAGPTGEPLRYTGGFVDFIDPARDWTGANGSGADRVKDFGAAPTSGTVDMEVLEEWLKATFEYGSSEKLAFCGNRALLTINQIVRKNSVYNIYYGEKEYGMSVARVVCPFGEIVLKTHPLWNQNPSGVNGGTTYHGMDSWIAILDMQNLTYRPMDGRDTKYIPNQQTPGQDGMESGYLTECGLEFAHPVTHALARGFQVGAADS